MVSGSVVEPGQGARNIAGKIRDFLCPHGGIEIASDFPVGFGIIVLCAFALQDMQIEYREGVVVEAHSRCARWRDDSRARCGTSRRPA